MNWYNAILEQYIKDGYDISWIKGLHPLYRGEFQITKLIINSKGRKIIAKHYLDKGIFDGIEAVYIGEVNPKFDKKKYLKILDEIED